LYRPCTEYSRTVLDWRTSSSSRPVSVVRFPGTASGRADSRLFAAVTGSDGRPTGDQLRGVASVRWAYGTHGKTIEESYFGTDGERTEDKNRGVATVRWQYDTDWNTVEEGYLGADQRSKADRRLGPATIRWQYDQYGREIGSTMFDQNGKPARGSQDEGGLNSRRNERSGALREDASLFMFRAERRAGPRGGEANEVVNRGPTPIEGPSLDPLTGHRLPLFDLAAFQRRHEFGIRDLSRPTRASFELGQILLREKQEGVALERRIGDRAPGDDSSLVPFQTHDGHAQVAVRGSREAHEVGHLPPAAVHHPALRPVPGRPLRPPLKGKTHLRGGDRAAPANRVAAGLTGRVERQNLVGDGLFSCRWHTLACETCAASEKERNEDAERRESSGHPVRASRRPPRSPR
jgi:hypothetical protein